MAEPKQIFGLKPDIVAALPREGYTYIVTFKVRGDKSGDFVVYDTFHAASKEEALEKVSEAVVYLMSQDSTYNVCIKRVTAWEIDRARLMLGK